MNLLITRLPQALTVWEFAYRMAIPLPGAAANEQETGYQETNIRTLAGLLFVESPRLVDDALKLRMKNKRNTMKTLYYLRKRYE